MEHHGLYGLIMLRFEFAQLCLCRSFQPAAGCLARAQSFNPACHAAVSLLLLPLLLIAHFVMCAASTWSDEQDWMHNQWAGMNATLSNATLAKTWLRQMGAGADSVGINILYCMTWARMVLASVEVPAVTGVRASVDYSPGSGQWNIGYTSLLADAVSLRPSKDIFWSSGNQVWKTIVNQTSGRFFQRDEWDSRLQVAVAALSTGPVTPGDLIGATPAELVLRACMSNGTLLQPDRPATPIDASILAMVSGGALRGTVWSTVSNISGAEHVYVLAAETGLNNLTADDLGLDQLTKFLAVEAKATPATLADGSAIVPVSATSPLAINSSSANDFQLWTVSPTLPNGWTLLGEASAKFVPVSGDRFVSVTASASSLKVDLRGAPVEEFTVIAFAPQA
eukprot:SAG22_NODE_3260_length_1825_cov_1.060255_1_plen_394_part_10